MTNEEALLVNAAILARAKKRTGDSNFNEWHNKRCVLCTRPIEEGQEYLSWCPLDYKPYAKLEQTPSLTHILCLRLGDRHSYPQNRKTAVNKQQNYPLLTNELMYDIIIGKETNDCINSG